MKELSKIVQESVDIYRLASYFHSGEETDLEEVKYYLLSSQISLLEAELERKKGMIRDVSEEFKKECFEDPDGGIDRYYDNVTYNEPINEDITYLQDQITKCKELIK